MVRRYVLDEHGEPRPEPDLLVWAKWLEHDERRIVRQQRWQDERGRDVFVSTVFMGLDHNFGMHGQPVLWETMTFVDGEDVDQRRYTSREAAIRGHRRTVLKHGGVDLES